MCGSRCTRPWPCPSRAHVRACLWLTQPTSARAAPATWAAAPAKAALDRHPAAWAPAAEQEELLGLNPAHPELSLHTALGEWLGQNRTLELGLFHKKNHPCVSLVLFPFTFSPDQLLVGATMGFLGRASCVLKSHRPADALSVLFFLHLWFAVILLLLSRKQTNSFLKNSFPKIPNSPRKP